MQVPLGRLVSLACAATLHLGASRVAGEVLHTEPLPAPSGAAARVEEIGRGARTSINFWEMGPSGGMASHLHKEHEEIIVVQGGRAETRIGDETFEVGPGDVLVVRPGTVHGARVIGAAPFYGVSLFAPGFDGKDRWPAPAAEDP